MAVGEECVAVLYPGIKERTCDSSGFSIEGTLLSAFAVLHCGVCVCVCVRERERERERERGGGKVEEKYNNIIKSQKDVVKSHFIANAAVLAYFDQQVYILSVVFFQSGKLTCNTAVSYPG